MHTSFPRCRHPPGPTSLNLMSMPAKGSAAPPPLPRPDSAAIAAASMSSPASRAAGPYLRGFWCGEVSGCCGSAPAGSSTCRQKFEGAASLQCSTSATVSVACKCGASAAVPQCSNAAAQYLCHSTAQPLGPLSQCCCSPGASAIMVLLLPLRWGRRRGGAICRTVLCSACAMPAAIAAAVILVTAD